MPEYDIVITGAGPVGSALALLLASRARHPERIALIGKRVMPAASTGVSSSAEHTPSASAADPRTMAINQGSRSLLEQLGAWPHQCADIGTVHVSQRGRLGRTLICHDEFNAPRLGSVVLYESLLHALHQAVHQSAIQVIQASPSVTRLGGVMQVNADATRLRSRLVVQSDGAKPAGVQRAYNQHAVLTTILASRPRAQWAYERFTTEGPLALLPHPSNAEAYAVVWCCSPARAAQLHELNDVDFASALQELFGDRLGHFRCAAPRHVFPLKLHAGPQIADSRTVVIGNAAQTLHPVAGQGLNLGLRDAAQLAHLLGAWLRQPQDDPYPMLRAFASQRRPDRWLTTGITDFLPRVFATRSAAIEHASGLGLLTLDLSATLRAPLARHLLHGLRA